MFEFELLFWYIKKELKVKMKLGFSSLKEKCVISTWHMPGSKVYTKSGNVLALWMNEVITVSMIVDIFPVNQYNNAQLVGGFTA